MKHATPISQSPILTITEVENAASNVKPKCNLKFLCDVSTRLIPISIWIDLTRVEYYVELGIPEADHKIETE